MYGPDSDRTDILLVGLDPDGVRIFTIALGHAGFAVRTVDRPHDVVEAALAARPRLVVTSYPAYTAPGVTATHLLRADLRTATIPILNAATHVFPSELSAAQEAGVTLSLALPASLETLVAEARRLIESAAPRVG